MSLRQRLLHIIQDRRFVLGCVLAGIALRLIWVAFVHPPQVDDYDWYYDRAESIARGDGYAVEGIPTAYWPPGYPGFLGIVFSVFGVSVVAGQLLNILLSAATIYLGYVLCRQLFHSETAARITALILALHPNQVAYNSLLCSEIWFTFLFVAGAVALLAARERTGLIALGGLSWGIATLTKPQFFFLPAIFILIVFARRKEALKLTAMIYATIALCLAPWCLRNYDTMGKFILSTNGGFTLLQGNNPYATGTYLWLPEMEAMMGDLQKAPDAPLEYDEVRRDKRAWQVAAHYMREHPWRTVAMWPKKVMYMYRSDVDGFFYSMGTMDLSSKTMKLTYFGVRSIAELFYIGMLGLAAFAMWPLVRRRTRRWWAAVASVLYFTAIPVVFVAIARYHFPIVPWIGAFAGVGAAVLLGVKAADPVTELADTETALEPGYLAPEKARAMAASNSSGQ